MTARDFTPTDEQWERIAEEIAAAQNVPFVGSRQRKIALRALTSPAFQSIIAAAKAEAVEEYKREQERSRRPMFAPGTPVELTGTDWPDGMRWTVVNIKGVDSDGCFIRVRGDEWIIGRDEENDYSVNEVIR